MGLHEDTQTWEYITEEQYQALRPVTGNALPTMALSKVKKDEDGNPDSAKYRIVALCNLDPHDWSSSDCFAPVLSPLELRLLISISTKMKIVPKTGDISQAFVQSVLPDDKKYVVKLPHGCPNYPQRYLPPFEEDTLWPSLQSPCKKNLLSLGLRPCANAPCIFHGTIIPREPPLYLGLVFVDDFVYFSANPAVEQKFEEQFSKSYKIDFQGKVSHFLALNSPTSDTMTATLTST